MAQRRRVENPVVDVSISDDESFSFVFHKAAAELTKLYSLAVDGHVAFDAGARHAYVRTLFSFSLFSSYILVTVFLFG